MQYRLLPPFKPLPASQLYTASNVLLSLLKLIVTVPRCGSLSFGHSKSGILPEDITEINKQVL